MAHRTRVWRPAQASSVVFSAVGLLAGLACGDASEVGLERFDVDAGVPLEALELPDLPSSRPFLMGFTYQPYDWNEDAFERTFDYLREHGELVTLFHDVGIPWDRALHGTPLPEPLEAELARQAEGSAAFDHVVLVLSVLGPDRVSLAHALDASGTVPRQGPWAEAAFNHPDVISAYLNHARDLIGRFDPKFFAYVAEVDAVFSDPADDRVRHFIEFAETVYTTLKREYPKLVVFAEFVLADDAFMAEREDVIRAILPFTDLYAVSTYVDQADGVGGDATRIPEDWFTRVRSLAPGKPFAVLESGFIASPFMHPTQGIAIAGRRDRLLIPGGPRSQALFTVRLLEAANELDAAFVNLWAVRDLDRLFDAFAPDSDLNQPMLRLARDRGLYDELGRPRPALRIWEAWRVLPRRERPAHCDPRFAERDEPRILRPPASSGAVRSTDGAPASGLPTFRARGGARDVGGELYGILSFHEHFALFGRFAYNRLIGDAERSPIVRVAGSRDQVFVGGGIFWLFR